MLTLGTMNFGADWHGVGAADEKTARALVDMALAAGVNLIDTADIYGRGASESLLGKILKGRRDKVFLATKVLGEMRLGDPASGGLGRRHIVSGLDASLKRLKTDYVDLYMPHAWDSRVPLEESLEAFHLLKKAGKVRVLGCSNFDGGMLRQSLDLVARRKWRRFEFDQVQYSAACRFHERHLIPVCVERQVSVLAWSPLGGGLLTGKYAGPARPPGRRQNPLNAFPMLPEARLGGLIKVITQIAKLEGMTTAQAALGYVLAKPWLASAVVGARSPEQLQELLAAKPLSPRCVWLIDQAGVICSVL